VLDPTKRIQENLIFLYGKREANRAWYIIQGTLTRFKEQNPLPRENTPTELFTERDAILITYGDQFQEHSSSPLKTLAQFLGKYIGDLIPCIHLLPFYPYSSDDGFSVTNYRQVNPDLGTWEDIARLNHNYHLMFDAVINHISRSSDWFQNYLEGNAPYLSYFITVDPATDLSGVTRPRDLPLLTPVETESGIRHVWTTFSPDQIDLNYASPDLLIEIIDLLLFYIQKGAQIIRLDAIAYLWKEIGTTCIHLPQTHAVVKIFRAITDLVAPGTVLITETNVPHKENVSYFGEPLSNSLGDEAHMVYQFSLAPLVIHTFHTQNARILSQWVDSLELPFTNTTFFNFIASHDGIGVRPVEGLLDQTEVQDLVNRTQAHGGKVSYKTNPDGSRSVYELNITLYDALNNPNQPDPGVDIPRFLASQAIMLSIAGVPGIYVHSLFGSRNCHKCASESGRARSINREKFKLQDLETALDDPETIISQVFSGYAKLFRVRGEQPAFHPHASQKVLLTGDRVFGLFRQAQDTHQTLICLINISENIQQIDLHDQVPDGFSHWLDLLDEGVYHLHKPIHLDPYQVMWLEGIP
jgi:glycosidase